MPIIQVFPIFFVSFARNLLAFAYFLCYTVGVQVTTSKDREAEGAFRIAKSRNKLGLFAVPFF